MAEVVVETGVGVANADSFATRAAATAYAANLGVTLPTADALDVLLRKATAYLKSLTYAGAKTYADVPGSRYLPFPRTGLVVDEAEWPGDAVPQDIVDACCQLCIEQYVNSVNLAPTNTTAGVKREKIGPLETEYVGSSRTPKAHMPAVDALLAGWVVRTGMLRVGRG